jgi:hypothetical protein
MQDPHLGAYGASDTQLQSLFAQFQQQPLLIEPRSKKITRHKFTPDEDGILRQLVTQCDTSDWAQIAQHFPSRTARQCRDRWKHYLSPEVTTGNWTAADDQLLVEKVAELGSRWSAIAQLFPGRTDIGVKNHYISITGRKAKEERDRHAAMLPEDGLGRQFQGAIGGQFPMQEGRPDIARQIGVKKK